MIEHLPLLFLETWMIIVLVVIGLIIIGFAILKRLIKIAIFVALVVLVIIGIRAIVGA